MDGDEMVFGPGFEMIMVSLYQRSSLVCVTKMEFLDTLSLGLEYNFASTMIVIRFLWNPLNYVVRSN